ncbi:MAG: hypothetical protein AB1444_07020 [Spirochaetota bacterium]
MKIKKYKESIVTLLTCMKAYLQSKQRVDNFGEVLTPKHIVNAIHDLVKQMNAN